MTDRLAELHGDLSPHSTGGDIETGADDGNDELLGPFNREVSAITRVLTWANETLRTISAQHTGASSTEQLDAMERKVEAVRKRLKRLAGENKVFAREHAGRPATVRTRLVRYTKLGKDFLDVTAKLEDARANCKAALESDVKGKIMSVNPAVRESEVESAIAGEQSIESVLVGGESAALQHEIADIRSRNEDIGKLTRSIVELHQVFTDMSILVEGQQELINNIEYNVTEAKADVHTAAQELDKAHAYQKAARKKKICIAITCTVILVVIVIVILIILAVQTDIFKGGGSSNNSNAPATQAPAQPAAQAPARLFVQSTDRHLVRLRVDRLVARLLDEQ